MKKFFQAISTKKLILVFSIVQLALGSVMIATVQADLIPDFYPHIYRIDSILNGDLVAHPVDSISSFHTLPEENVGGAVDWKIVEYGKDFHDRGSVEVDSITVSNDQTADVPLNNTAVYPAIAYGEFFLPAAISKALDLPVAIELYILEFAALLTSILIWVFSLWLLPKFRLAYASIMILLSLINLAIQNLHLQPILTSYPFAISADTLASALIGLYFCALYSCYHNMSRRKLVLLFVAGCVMSICKLAYFPLILCSLILLLVVRKNYSSDDRGVGDRKLFRRIILIGNLFCIAVSAITVAFSMQVAVVPDHVTGAEIQQRTQGLIRNPLPAIESILYSLWNHQSYRSGA